MRIDSTNEELSAMLDGELSGDELSMITARLQEDPELMEEMESLKSLRSLLREEGPDMAPMGFHHRVMARIDEEEPQSSWSLSAWFSRWHIERIGLAFAAAAVLFLLWPGESVQTQSEQWRTESAARAPIESSEPALAKNSKEPEQVLPAVVEQQASKVESKPIGKMVSNDLMKESGLVKKPVTSESLDKTKLAEESAMKAEFKKVERELAEAAAKEKPVEVDSKEPANARPTMRTAGYQYTLKGNEAKVKQALIRIASGFQGDVKASGNDSLLVEIPADRLTDFHTELGRLGVTMDSQADLTMFPGDTVTIRINLEDTEPAAVKP